MSTRIYDYMLLPEQLNILYEKYSILTHEVLDSYVYVCDVYKDGITKKTEFICVQIKKYNEPTIYSKSIDLNIFLEKCFLNKSKEPVSIKKKIS
jgi:hypothetical protein